uniref:Uncharacterized protein YxjG n=1 Tax=Chlamydia pneumoniae TaxID=83558 RepID=A0A0F7WXY1_CHLPN|nr:Uncharacterized protein YxjG [Chlamydia pneumoniae]
MNTSLKRPLKSHFDVVGSFLRPEHLKKTRESLEEGSISLDQLMQIEDIAIQDLIKKQKAAGLSFITDGEFRRATWHYDFMWGFHGVGHHRATEGVFFDGERAMIDDTYLTDKISVSHHPFVDHFKFVKALEDEFTTAKQTLPAPAQFLKQMIFPNNIEVTRKFYPTNQELIEDIVAGYRKVIRDLYDAGCRYLQLDDCTRGGLVDPRVCSWYGIDEKGLQDLIQQYLLINNLVIADRPDDLVVNLHVCRGNYHSKFFASGSYDFIAKPLFEQTNVDGYYLEFDHERSGDFSPLTFISGEKTVCLGLVTSKTPTLENKDEVIARIHQAADYLPLERLSLSPQCGFASCEIGNKLTEEEQWAKVALVKEISEEVWK